MVTDLSEKIWPLVSGVQDGDEACSAHLEMVADQVAVLAVGAGDEHGAMVVALLGQAMRRASLADVAREGELV